MRRPNLNPQMSISFMYCCYYNTKDEMSQIIEMMAAFGAHSGVVFHDPTEEQVA